MGYYTTFELDYELPEQDKSSAVNDFISECDKKDIEIPTDVLIQFDSALDLEVQLEEALTDDSFPDGGWGPLMNYVNGDADSGSWYEHERDMLILSNRFPTVKFTLRGSGEENSDVWVKYFLGGKKQVCKAKITFDEFDPEKLE